MRRKMQTILAGLLVLVSLTVTQLAGPETALAGDATVTWCSEAGFDAALSTVQNSGGGTVTFGCTGTITFDRGSKSISSDVTILGNGGVILSQGGWLPGRLFTVGFDAELTLVGVTLRNGTAVGSGVGGAIRNSGRLTVIASTFSDNNADDIGGAIDNFGTTTVIASTFSNNIAGNGGGAIANFGSLTVRDSTFSSNSAGSFGGAIRNNSGPLIVTGSTFSNNSAGSDGGAINSINGPATVTGSTFSGNSAGRGGAIYHAENATIAASTFRNNSAGSDGGAIYNLGATATVTDSTFSGNTAGSDGGAISNVGPLETTATIMASTFSDNDASGTGGLGGAVHSNATLSVTASTFSSNSASGPNGQGGAISSSGAATIMASTFSGNSSAAFSGGGAIRNFAQLTLVSSIMADSPRGFNCRDLNTPVIVSGGYNLSDDDSCNLADSGDQEGSSVTPDLGDLQDNGGLTATMLPGTLSDAIDAADCAVSSAQDQRGAIRPTTSGPANAPVCDIGAVEVEGIVPLDPVNPPVQIFALFSPGGAEGSPVTVFAVATGPDNENLGYAFDCDNDGAYETPGTGTGVSGSGTCIFGDDGNYTVGVQVCDVGDASNCDAGTASIDISNVVPQVDPGSSFEMIFVGTHLSLSGSLTDPGTDTWTATVDYGDGSGVQPLALAGTGFTLHHVYTDGDNDPYTITVCVTDDDGGTGCANLPVDVYSTSELVGLLADPIAEAPLAEEIQTPMLEMLAEIEASLEAGEIATACVQWHAFGNYVESHQGELLPPEAVEFIVFRVNAVRAFLECETILNPTITEVANDGPVNEGSPATIAVAATGGSGSLSYTFDCDDDGSYETNGVGNQGQCMYPDDGSYAVGVQVTDSSGGSATSSTTVNVINVAPLVDAGAKVSIDESSVFSRPGSFADPGADSWTATVDYGDGFGDQRLVLAGLGFILEHVYTDGDNDPYTVTVCVTDDDGGVGCDSFEIEVLSASELVIVFVEAVEDMQLPTGMSNSLVSRLAEIDSSIEAEEIVDACNQLDALSNYVEAQAGKKLSQAQADDLITGVDRIRASLGCS